MADEAAIEAPTETSPQTDETAVEPLVEQPTETPAGLVGEDGTFTEGWQDNLGEDFADMRPTLSKFNNLQSMAKSYHELERMMGDRAGKISPLTPESTPEEVSSFRKAMGVPDEAAGYDIKAPENLPEGMQWDDRQANVYGEIFHKNNASPALVQELMAAQVDEAAARQAESDAAYKTFIEEDTAKLKAEWGDSFDKKINEAKRSAATVGLDVNGPLFQHPEIKKAMANMAGLVSESKLITGHENPDLMDNSARAQDIMNNPQNPYHTRYYEGDEATANMVAGLLKG
tara:strand:+ start:8313 stop:9173 length:861 start_codon:yes stop_codon:yes gene_type:complete